MENSDTKPGRTGSTDEAPSAPREHDAIYQGGRVVARVTNPQVDSNAREIRFEELSSSEELLLPEDCEFRQYRILVQRIDDAAKIQKGAAHKGRVLRGVTAEILGYREQ
ncbi:MAG TPA: hypothetical protein VGW33_06535 [Terriglobia bacterium]|nr:hypothetical protein [Terriglobia bacterium]